MSLQKNLVAWIVEELSVPSADFNGMCPCPYAKKAWFQNQVRVVETESSFWDKVNEEVDSFNDSHEVVVVAQQEPFCEYEELEHYCMALNKWFAQQKLNIWLLSFQHDITMVFVQRLSKLDDASAKLFKKGYYDNYTEDDFSHLITERRKRRLYDARNDARKEEADENDAWRCS